MLKVVQFGILLVVCISIIFEGCINYRSQAKEIMIKSIDSRIDSIFKNATFNYTKKIKFNTDSLIILFQSSDTIYNSKFTDSYFQLLIYNLNDLVENFRIVKISLQVHNKRAEIFNAYYDFDKVKAIRNNFVKLHSYKSFIEYSLYKIAPIDLIGYDSTLGFFYESTKKEEYNLRFRDLLYEYALVCDGIPGADSISVHSMSILTKYYAEFKKDERRTRVFFII